MNEETLNEMTKTKVVTYRTRSTTIVIEKTLKKSDVFKFFKMKRFVLRVVPILMQVVNFIRLKG